MNVAELVGRTLAGLGAGTAFGVVGSGNFEVTNALRAGGVRFVAARHEGGAASMADAYARMSGKVSVLSLHQGCGLTNAVTGITEAAKSRTPMIVLTADSASASVLSNFRIDQDGLATAVGAVPERVHSAESAVADTVRAFRTARQERRTVVLNLPLDIQAQPAPAPPGTLPPIAGPAPMRPDIGAAADLADLLIDAERPVFIAGRGARGSREPLRELASRSGALLATSAVAHGLFHDDEFALGISGGFASPVAAELIVGADLVVGWGCALNMWTTRHGKLLSPHAKLVQVDLEQAALGAHRPIDLGVVGDAGCTAEDVLSELGDHKAVGYRTEEVAARIAAGRWNDVEHEDLSRGGRIDPRTLSKLLDELLPAERIVSIDSGNFMGYPSAYLSVPDEQGFCFTQAFQSIGLGLGTAIGAALARPGPAAGAGHRRRRFPHGTVRTRHRGPARPAAGRDRLQRRRVRRGGPPLRRRRHDHGPLPRLRPRRHRPRLRLRRRHGAVGRRPLRGARMARGPAHGAAGDRREDRRRRRLVVACGGVPALTRP